MQPGQRCRQGFRQRQTAGQGGWRLFCRFHISFSDLSAEPDGGNAGKPVAEDGSKVTDNYNDRVGGYHVASEVSENNGVHGKSDAPDQIVSEGWQGKMHKIMKQHFVAHKYVRKAQPDVSMFLRQSDSREARHRVRYWLQARLRQRQAPARRRDQK